MNTDSLRESFERDGFVIVRQFLAAAEFGRLTEELERYIREVVPGLPDTSAFYVDRERPETLKQMQHMGVDSFFRQYPKHPRWTEMAEQLLGEPVEGREPEWFNKPPEWRLAPVAGVTSKPPGDRGDRVTSKPPVGRPGTEHPTPPHQDNYYFCLRPPNVVTLWLALDGVDEENGCLRYVRGSHRLGIRPHHATAVLGFSQGITDYGADDESREAVIRLEPGDLVAHHGETIHRAEANRSATRHRRAFAIVYQGQSCRRDEDAYRRYQENLSQQHAAMGLKT